MRIKPPRLPQKQSGYVMLLAALLAIGVVSAAMPLMIRYFNQQDLSQQERTTGNELAQISVGLQGYIAAIQNGTMVMPGTQNGLLFLKSPACGGPAANPPDGYIACTLGNYGPYDTLFGGTFQTTFTNNAATKFYEARLSFIPMYSEKNKLGQIAANIVNAAKSTPAGSPSGTFATYLSNVAINSSAGSPQIMVPTDPDFGRITLVANNAPSNDIYLRVDGTNQMLASLNMGGQDINNAKNINAAGNLNLVGDALVGGGGQFAGDLFSNKNITASEKVIASDVVAVGSGVPKTLSRAVFDKTVMTGNPISVTSPSCQSGSSPQVFTSIQSINVPSGYSPPSGEVLSGIAGGRLNVSSGGSGWSVVPQVNIVTTKITFTTQTDPNTGGITVNPVQTSNSSWVDTDNAQVIVSTKCN